MIRATLISLALAALGASHAGAQDVRVRTGSTAAEPVAGLEAPVFARGLGVVSDMAVGADGTVFAADRRSGRIWVLRDRAMDGRADTVQALTPRFDAPGGLAVHGDALLVSDRSGLWEVSGAGTPRLVAPFANAGALGPDYPIALISQGKAAGLALNMPNGQARRLAIDLATGRATETARWPGRILAFTKGAPGAPVLTLIEAADGTVSLAGLGPEPIVLDAPATHGFIDAEAGHVVLSGPEGVRLRRASLLGLEDGAESVLRGLRAGAVAVDARGILVASPQDGTIRVVRPARLLEPPKPEADAPAPDAALDPDLLILRGSGIDRASVFDEIAASDDPAQEPPSE